MAFVQIRRTTSGPLQASAYPPRDSPYTLERDLLQSNSGSASNGTDVAKCNLRRIKTSLNSDFDIYPNRPIHIRYLQRRAASTSTSTSHIHIPISPGYSPLNHMYQRPINPLAKPLPLAFSIKFQVPLPWERELYLRKEKTLLLSFFPPVWARKIRQKTTGWLSPSPGRLRGIKHFTMRFQPPLGRTL